MEVINISIVSGDGSEVFFKMKKNISLHRVFNAYKERQAIAECVFFYINNVKINATDTPGTINLKDGDKIYAKIIKIDNNADDDEYEGSDIGDDDIPDEILNIQPDNEISILVMNADDIFQCAIRESTLLISYLTSCVDKSANVLFFYNGDELNISDTPKSLGMLDGSMIQIFTSD